MIERHGRRVLPLSACGEGHGVVTCCTCTSATDTPQLIIHTKQYKLSGNHEEIIGTIWELEKVGIIHHTHSPYKSPEWSVKMSDGTWQMAVDYQELNKVVLPLDATVPLVVDTKRENELSGLRARAGWISFFQREVLVESIVLFC